MAKLDNKLEPNQKLETNWKDITENGGIEIRFIGKANAQRIARKVKPRILKENLELGVNLEEKPKNLVIEGDNLKVMSSLYQYHGKIDLILTDPPYNTGKDFRYNDRWNEDPNDEGLGGYVKSDDTSRHTKWMKFMFPRLQMMKQLLKIGGVLAICIDYRELFHLGKMCDEIFGEENRLGIINWQKSYSLKAITGAGITSATDYVLVYAKNADNASTGKLEHTEVQKERFSNPDNDPKGEWRSVSSLAPAIRKNLIYAIQNPFSGELYYPLQGRSWRYQKSLMKPLLEEWGSEYEEKDLNDGNVLGLILKGFDLNNLENPKRDLVFKQAKEKAQWIYDNKPWPRLIYLKKGLGKIRFKLYFAEVDQGISPLTWWDYEEDEKPLLLEEGTTSWSHQISGHSQAGTAELKARIDFEGDFVGVKPLKLFTKIFQLWGSSPQGGICFDPFAGTGTTGEVIIEFNKKIRTERERERERERESKTDWFHQIFERQRIWVAIYSSWTGI
ncbi:MAG: site-specific DNA-methyltransferase [Candidatus Moeniiplasma glomeromycotorum]|nr:site-specific DNA-methyltransferase [Candidatus Moeniiplasma glomeromycotorum]MCE8162246.1 site-specific DNA-methyltransferase [Candidatus Moeniiplasma glomeromycotorum]MCE8166098.1 site-specific DNA-methyltransferase [Candidatus Moeniiplasma glomeromycotorum]MCE8166645.1 site-specific DNA-methyltransferase [Candidatus Moeniiplasma glomeromycotorum]